MKKKAILAGASGAIGSSLLQQLLDSNDYSEVLVLARKNLDIQHPKLKQVILDFSELGKYAAEITGDVVFCCLGTTKSQTPDQQEYRKIDYQYPLDLAAIALGNGAQSYHLVSSIGANKDSSVFYTRTKGEVEHDLKAIPFKTIHIYQPSMLVADRHGKRAAEGIGKVIMQIANPFLFGALKKYRSIKVAVVAKAMLKKSLEDTKGIFIHESDQIQVIGG
jgi:uncharacterized protein YbjT (DUF2867 family)